MATLLGIVSIASAIGSLVCFIMVLVKLFKAEGVLKGILGIICGIYPFIWGWIKKDELDIGKLMMTWTVFVGVGVLVNILASLMITTGQ